MKRFLLFCGSQYYPGGGWYDFSKSFDSKEEALKAAAAPDRSYDWWHIVDRDSGKIVETST